MGQSRVSSVMCSVSFESNRAPFRPQKYLSSCTSITSNSMSESQAKEAQAKAQEQAKKARLFVMRCMTESLDTRL